jgi:hypothetical protein
VGAENESTSTSPTLDPVGRRSRVDRTFVLQTGGDERYVWSIPWFLNEEILIFTSYVPELGLVVVSSSRTAPQGLLLHCWRCTCARLARISEHYPALCPVGPVSTSICGIIDRATIAMHGYIISRASRYNHARQQLYRAKNRAVGATISSIR